MHLKLIFVLTSEG